MKRSYLTQFERILIARGTLVGDLTLLRFRFIQLGRAMEAFIWYVIDNLKEIKTEEKELEMLLRRVAYEIDETPTGEFRNFLCDINIQLHLLVILKSTKMKTKNTVIAILKIMFLLLVGILLFFAIPSCSSSSRMINSEYGRIHKYQLKHIKQVKQYQGTRAIRIP